MKNLKLLALLGVILISGTLVGCGSDKNENDDLIIEDITGKYDAVINYNDSLVDITSKCLTYEDSIWTAYDDANSTTEDIMTAIDNTVSECSNAANEINKLGDWEGDSSLKDGVLSIVEKEINYYSKFKELLPLLDKAELTEEEDATYNSIYSELETLDKELAEANDNLISIQEQFAKNHGFELEEVSEETTETAE